METEQFVVCYARIKPDGTAREYNVLKYGWVEAQRAVRAFRLFFGASVTDWSITRSSDGIILAERKL